MAKIISHVWSSARGSIAGITYLTTPSGQIIARQRTKPVQSTSPGSTAAKDAMIQSVAAWAALSVVQKNAWNQWATTNGTKTGRQEFIAGHCLMNYGILTEPPVWPVPVITETAPTFTGHPSFTLTPAVFTAVGTGVAFQVQNTSPYKCISFIELSPGMSNGRYYWKGPWDTSMNQADETAVAEKHKFEFTGLVVGLRYYARARIVSDGGAAPYIGTVVSPALITFQDAVNNPV